MSISNVMLSEHKKKADQFSSYKTFLEQLITQTLVNAELDSVEIFNMNGIDSNIRTGTKKRLVILVNHPQENPDSITIKREGMVIAEYIQRGNDVQQLNIPSDLLGAFIHDNTDTFKFILNELNRLVYLQAQYDYSWKLTSKKDELTKQFTDAIKSSQERYIRDDKRKMDQFEEDIRYHTYELKVKFDNRNRLRGNIETARAKLDAVDAKLIKDLDNIINNPKVADLYIKDGLFIVHTAPIYAYHDVTGDRYYIGNMRIEMNPNNTEVRFYGDNPRKSYWTENDPHPHVDGARGSACLGNVSATIAELCSQMELYALTMVCIDFLESVNTSDPAGKNINNWDKVDEEGTIIVKGGSDEAWDEEGWTCENCDERQSENDDTRSVYQSYTGDADGHGEWGEERYVCENCCNDEYTWNEGLDAYIRDGHCDIDEDEEAEEE